MKKLAAAFVLSLAMLTACSSTESGNYWVNRGGDLVDIVRGNVQAGKGAAIKIEVTRLLHLGASWFDGKAWGLANRQVTSWQYKYTDWGLVLGYYNEINTAPLDRLAGSYGWTFPEGGGSYFQPAVPDNPLDLLTVRGKVCLFIGIDLELRFGEIIDFVAGVFGFDPANDDGDYRDQVNRGSDSSEDYGDDDYGDDDYDAP